MFSDLSLLIVSCARQIQTTCSYLARYYVKNSTCAYGPKIYVSTELRGGGGGTEQINVLYSMCVWCSAFSNQVPFTRCCSSAGNSSEVMRDFFLLPRKSYTFTKH